MRRLNEITQRLQSRRLLAVSAFALLAVATFLLQPVANAAEAQPEFDVTPVIPGDLLVAHYLDRKLKANPSGQMEVLHYAKGVADAFVYLGVREGVPPICPTYSRISWQAVDLLLGSEVRRLELAGKPIMRIREMPLTKFIHQALLHHYGCKVR